MTVHFRLDPFLKFLRNPHEIHSMNIHPMDQRETQVKGYPIRIDTRLQSRAWDDCPPLEKGPNVKEIKCNKSSCVMKCMPGFVKVRFWPNLRLCVGNAYAFFWNLYFWELILSLWNDEWRSSYGIYDYESGQIMINCQNPDYLSNNPSETYQKSKFNHQ